MLTEEFDYYTKCKIASKNRATSKKKRPQKGETQRGVDADQPPLLLVAASLLALLFAVATKQKQGKDSLLVRL